MLRVKITLIALCFLGYLTPVVAGEDVLTAVDAARQASFLKSLQRAANAARRNDRVTAQRALRDASHVAGYNLDYAPRISSCEQSAFRVPGWIMLQQARIGDGDGARESARNLGNALWTASALMEIACIQAGVRPYIDPRPNYNTYVTGSYKNSKSGKLLFTEAVQKIHKIGNSSLSQLTYRSHDFSILHRLNLPSRRESAWKTLRLATSYAATPTRPEYSRFRWPGEDISQIAPTLLKLIGFQAYLGDKEGMLQTVARIRNPQSQVYALAYAATLFRQTNQEATAIGVEKRIALLLEGLKPPELRAGTHYYLARLYMNGHDFDRVVRSTPKESAVLRVMEANVKIGLLHLAATEQNISEIENAPLRNQCLIVLESLLNNENPDIRKRLRQIRTVPAPPYMQGSPTPP